MGKKVNKKYKDRLFRFIFGDRRELLTLYNALNGTDYKDADKLEIVTLEDVIYMNMKNDVAFLFGAELVGASEFTESEYAGAGAVLFCKTV